MWELSKEVYPNEEGWIDLSPFWDEIQELGKARKEFRNSISSKNFRAWSDSPNDVGLAGEFGFGLLIGVKPDLELKRTGDGGIDFTIDGETIDIKTHSNLRNIRLILETSDSYKKRMHKNKKPVDCYVLMIIDLKGRRVRFGGSVRSNELDYCPVETKDFNGDIHDNYIIVEADLNKEYYKKWIQKI